MIDEQLYYSNSKINKLENTYDLYKTNDKKFNVILKRLLNDIQNVEDIDTIDKTKIYK